MTSTFSIRRELTSETNAVAMVASLLSFMLDFSRFNFAMVENMQSIPRSSIRQLGYSVEQIRSHDTFSRVREPWRAP